MKIFFKNPLIATVLIEKPIYEIWQHWINSDSIKIWNIPFDHWHCPKVENDVRDGGAFFFRMESKDGKEGFDYSGVYSHILPLTYIESVGGDGRKNRVEFESVDNHTIIRETFEPDSETPLAIQQNFTDSVLKKFKDFMEQDNK
ncbi:SRPBCC domain-containing protein [Sphingobacterium sp. SRCM116780]|uniref:SRPBCC domain-containing protein n=1 Tax=Sphingobacterium sp. SRCM116780 TaxID=2907623 RepID=UPI001F258F31|nr:SRPBCC domain-containing protein [Sphingobacterium sp. SRCM116780]UIR56757.1 SRPBCC domain-containing protein [Sphingobacterium sp. SRCM116780]